MIFVAIALGGALGATARYGLGSWVHAWAGSALPWGTLAVNLLGSFLLGVALRFTDAPSSAVSPEMRAFLAIGLLGAFTTFSAYSYETAVLLRDGAWLKAVTYSAGSVALGVLAIWGGLGTGAWILSRV